jgi:hypothetical protein
MRDELTNTGLPGCAEEYIDLVAKKVRYRRKVRREVREELAGHFADALHGITDEQERVETAMKLIKGFGEAKVLARLIRQGKKRCRPVWLRALLRTCQVFGIIVVLIVVRAASLLGTPGHATDFYAKLNELVRGGHDDSQNAQPLLDEAAAAMTPMPEWMDRGLPRPPLDVNDRELGELKAYLEANAKALELARQASQMPGRWMTSRREVVDPHITPRPKSWYAGVDFSADVMAQYLPPLSKVKSLGYLIRWDSCYQAHRGNTAVAFDDAMALMRIAALYEDKGILVDHLVGVALDSMGTDQLCRLAATCKPSAAALKDVQAELEHIFITHPMTLDLDCEKLFMDAQLECSYTEGGRMLVGGIPMACGGLWPVVKGLVIGFPSKAEIQSTVDCGYMRIDEMSRRTPWQQRVEARSGTPDYLKSQGLLMQVTMPGFEKVSELDWKTRAQRGATLTILVIERYRLEKGGVPDGLDELVKGGYLTELPMDPWSDKPLVYRKTAEGYTLYSVGPDFEDNGGTVAIVNGKAVTWSNNAASGTDVVFWPK